MSQDDYSEQGYYDHIVADMADTDANPVIEHVNSWEQFLMFKAAILRWLADQEQEWRDGLDQMALEQEHDEEIGPGSGETTG